MRKQLLLTIVISVLIYGCESNNSYPKPQGMLALEYNNPKPHSYQNDLFSFSYNEEALFKSTSPTAFSFYYPQLKGSVYMYYVPLENNLGVQIKNLEEKLSEHHKRASGIIAHPYQNNLEKKQGVLYEIQGDAASQAHFYITDREDHFIHGALYFLSKPNYDSILPAAEYVENDLRDFMESLKWK